tara:strand:- start:87 stop:299 length:213 start_codon:yes stop_codon:yes gene_type:complete
MPTYTVVISSKSKGKRLKKRRIDIFAQSPSDAEDIIRPTLKRGESIYDIGGKMSNMMALERASNKSVRRS